LLPASGKSNYSADGGCFIANYDSGISNSGDETSPLSADDFMH
jgi:hypothetical protein